MFLLRLVSSVVVLVMGAHAQSYRIATFEVDVTPPFGHALMAGGIPPASTIVDPLYAQGVVLLGGNSPIVWVSVDWCEIRNDAYDIWRDALAEAAGTDRERVLLAAIHQHDAPVADLTAQRLLDAVGLDASLCDVGFVVDCIERTKDAVRNALPHARSVTHYGVGVSTVESMASNRRVILEGGAPAYHRTSATPDPALRAQPTGLIDPHLRTLSFWNGDVPVAALTTYAVHPMSYYGRGGVSADFVGMARIWMRADLPDALYLYFSGCSGDVVAGKWNDGSESERPNLAQKLYVAMKEAWSHTKRYPLGEVQFRLAKLKMPLRDSSGFTAIDQQQILADATKSTFDRNLAAMGLSWRAAQSKGNAIDVCSVEFGEALFLLLPAESFVQYQLDAQQLRPDATVLTAGYGESAPGYIPSASAVNEGFIDAHSWCWVGPDAPVAMMQALKNVLAP